MVATVAVAAIAVVLQFRRSVPEDRIYRIGWAENPPFQERGSDGTPTGFAVELLREAARRRGIRLEWVEQPPDSEQALRSGRVDLWPIILVTAERRKVIHISEPYFESNICYITRSERGLSRLDDLANASISLVNLPINRKTILRSLPSARLLPRANTTQVIEDVCRGSADAGYTTELALVSEVLRGFQCGGSPIRLIPAHEDRWEGGIGATFAARAAADALRDEIGKLANQGALSGVLPPGSYLSGLALQTAQKLASARQQNQRLFAGTALALGLFVVALWQAIRINRERQKSVRAEQALRTKTEELDRYFDFSVDLLSIATISGRFVRLNLQWERMLGYPLPEIVGRPVADLVHPDDVAATREALARLAEQNQVMSFVNRFRRRDGTYCWLEWNAQPSGALFYAVARDISERTASESALRESEFFLNRSQEVAQIGSYKFDVLAGTWICSPALDRIFGIDEKFPKTVGGWLELITEEDRDGMAWHLQNYVLREHHRFNREYRIRRRSDGEVRWVQGLGELEFDDSGNPVRMIGTIQDVTDRKTAQLALERSEERLRHVAENISSVFYVLDTGEGGSRVSYVSPAFERVWGRSRETVATAPYEWTEAIHPDDRASVERTVLKAVEEGQASEVQYRIVRPDGSIRWILDKATPIRDTDGRLTGFVGLADDVTDRKHGEQERSRLEAELAQAQKMESIGRLAGGVAHDFNNMLSVILGYTELVKAELSIDSPLLRDMLEIEKAAHRAKGITHQLLAFSRKQIIAPRTIALNEHLASTSKTLARLIGEDINLRFSPAADLWPIRFDPSQLDQILMNLAVNARDAMPRGGEIVVETSNVRLDSESCRAIPGSSPGEYVLLRLTDNGTGMDAETMEHAFEPFFTTKEAGKGTGLGLATVYGIVRQSAGFIKLDSAPDRGTSFSIYIPKPQGQTETAGKASEEPIVGGAGTVLLVEDEEMVRQMTTAMLQAIGYRVITAATPNEALELCRRKELVIDLLITDVVMPGLSGPDLRNQIEEWRPGLKTLFISGYTSDAIVHRGVLESEVNFLPKPFSMTDLAREVRKVMQSE